MPLRLLTYMTRIWERHAREHQGDRLLPPIVPVVIHHGAQPWRGSPRFSDHLQLPSGTPLPTTPPLLDFCFVLDDLTLCSDADLLARGRDAIARLTLLALRNGRDHGNFFVRLVDAIRSLERDLRGPEALAALAALVSYVCQVSDEPLTTLRTTIACALPQEARSPFMTIAEQLKAEGRVEGRVEGSLAARRESLIVVLEARFGPLDDSERARIASAGGEQLLRWLRGCGIAPAVAKVLDG